MPLHHLPRVEPGRHLPHSLSSADRNYRRHLLEPPSCRSHLFTFIDIIAGVQTLQSKCLKKVRLRSAHDVRDQVAPSKLSLLITQHTSLLRRAGTTTEVHHQVIFPRKSPDRVLHSCYFLLLWTPHRPLLTASPPFNPVQSLFSWHLQNFCHHTRPSQMLRDSVSIGIVVSHLQHHVPHRPFTLERDHRLQNRLVEEISLTRATIADSGRMIYKSAWSFISKNSSTISSAPFKSLSASSTLTFAARRLLFRL